LLHFSHRADQKTYMDRLVWSPDEFSMNFKSFSP